MEYKYVECLCESPDHVIRISYDEYDCWVEVQLNFYLPWHKRVWNAIRYIFNVGPKWGGHWDATLLDSKKAREVCDILNEYIQTGKVDYVDLDNGTRVHLLAD